ncbi:MAG TPA: ImmA/IrrE family metallo-endopeptidase, partial [Elusimicrobiales bacterium]|nr:ImmA/IrrE family metallo-endopeptidase [Elusimicrobiales bacterium]
TNMIKQGWITRCENSIDQLKEVLNYFGIVSPKQWDSWWKSRHFTTEFKTSKYFKYDNFAMAAWLRKGELEAQKIQCSKFDEEKFRQAICKIRKLTIIRDPKQFWPKLVDICKQAGVAVVLVPEIPKTHTGGAVRWLKNKALMQLSLRYKTNDHFWFNFFHETGHILLHNKKNFFIEEVTKDDYETQADNFAANFLIPNNEFTKFRKLKIFNKLSIKEFAEKINIHSGIVVGRLQHNKDLGPNVYNDLKVRYERTRR